VLFRSHHRRGALWAAAASLLLFASVALAGWAEWLPVPAGQRPLPWTLPASSLIGQLALNSAAIVAVAFLASKLGGQLAQAGAQLVTEEQRSAALAAYSADVIRCLSSGLVTVDEAGSIRTFNEAASEITGIPADAARGRHLRDVLPDVAGLLGRTGVTRDLRREVVTFRRGGQERVLGVSGSPLRNPAERHIGYIVNFQDLTDLRRMEHQVQRAQRLAAVGQMAAGVAHEIRNPLASISGSIELLRRTPQLDTESAALMEIVVREVDRLNGLITDLLEYARPRERVPVKLALAHLLEETLRVFGQDRSQPGVTTALDVAPADAALEVVADAAQLRQVVWNLLRNAAESMPDGGMLRVSLRRHGADGVDIGVADQGVGMTAEQAEHIFEPFFTTKTRGSGLGLATVHRIVAEHGGQVIVDSAPGEGTRMTVRLPLAGGPAAYTPGMIIEERSGPSRASGT